MGRKPGFSWVHIAREGGRTNNEIRADVDYVNVTFPDLCTRFAIPKNQLVGIPDVHAGADNITKWTLKFFLVKEFVCVSNTGLHTIHCLMMDQGIFDSIVTLQFVSVKYADEFFRSTRMLYDPNLDLQPLDAS